jgi:uncharacterized protein (DUF952 family)
MPDADTLAAVAGPQLRGDGLYHLVTGPEWVGHRIRGTVEPASLDDEGFVHCSWGRQVAATVARHFDGVTDLLVLELDPAALEGAELVEEDTAGAGQDFPHVYGPVPLAAVRSVARLR